MIFYKYQGAGNDFLIADNRKGDIILDKSDIQHLCDRRYGIGADGLMLVENADGYDFRMVYYNSDGSGGMMCGNGGRCIVAFAADLGIDHQNFIAADGEHEAEILEDNGVTKTVKLRMKDVDTIKPTDTLGGVFINTGTRHFVVVADDIDNVDVVGVGRRLRNDPAFAPEGANINFIQRCGNILKVRTYEKGVEDETFACGTGITASAIIAWHLAHNERQRVVASVNERQLIGMHLAASGILETNNDYPINIPVHTEIQAFRDRLAVDFTPTPSGASDVYLTGPATKIAKVIIEQ